jgi:hypothetical protein
MSIVRQQLEPCVSCGEDTSIGSVFYSDRLVNRDGGGLRYLCSLCARQVVDRRGGRGMTDEQRRELEKAAFALGSFVPGGH